MVLYTQELSYLEVGQLIVAQTCKSKQISFLRCNSDACNVPVIKVCDIAGISIASYVH